MNVSVRSPGQVTVALRTADLEREAGASGATDRPVDVTIATARIRIPRAGRYKVLLKPRGSVRRRLKGHGSFTARYTVQARAKSGFVQVVNRRVRVVGSSARTR